MVESKSEINAIGLKAITTNAIEPRAAIIKPITVNSDKILSTNIWWLIAFAAVLLPLVLIRKQFVIGRYKGVLLFVAYVIFIGLAFS